MTKELRHSLGDDVLFIFRLFVGPIQGMNLRNLSCHGYLNLNDLIPIYNSFLIYLLLSLKDFECVRMMNVIPFENYEIFIKKLPFEVKIDPPLYGNGILIGGKINF